MPLTHEERLLVREVFQLGPVAFYDQGKSDEDYYRFMLRADVAAEVQTLLNDFRDSESLTLRRQFLAKETMAKYVPTALAILKKALSDPVYMQDNTGRYMKDANGSFILKEPRPSAEQLNAAYEVFDRMGIVHVARPGSHASIAVRITTGAAAQEMLEIKYAESDDNPEARKLSRERMRKAIQILGPRFKEILPQLDKVTDEAVIHNKRDRLDKRKRRKVKSRVVDE